MTTTPTKRSWTTPGRPNNTGATDGRQCTLEGHHAQHLDRAGTDVKNTLATEQVYENGFDPLEGGFRVDGVPFEVFDQWVEVLPTEQAVAVEYQTGP